MSPRPIMLRLASWLSGLPRLARWALWPLVAAGAVWLWWQGRKLQAIADRCARGVVEERVARARVLGRLQADLLRRQDEEAARRTRAAALQAARAPVAPVTTEQPAPGGWVDVEVDE